MAILKTEMGILDYAESWGRTSKLLPGLVGFIGHHLIALSSVWEQLTPNFGFTTLDTEFKTESGGRELATHCPVTGEVSEYSDCAWNPSRENGSQLFSIGLGPATHCG